LNLQNIVKLIGYIPDEEVNNHYQMGDVFIMPSKGEGFGIVFIEAMACGSPVIAGNQDGSVDALKNGELGVLVNPNNVDEIINAVIKQHENQNSNNNHVKFELQKKVLDHFGFKTYKKRLKSYLFDDITNQHVRQTSNKNHFINHYNI
jgi:glycosyltransferase involved in cell wall biosynthesis